MMARSVHSWGGRYTPWKSHAIEEGEAGEDKPVASSGPLAPLRRWFEH